jgi:hypothetical protein
MSSATLLSAARRPGETARLKVRVVRTKGVAFDLAYELPNPENSRIHLPNHLPAPFPMEFSLARFPRRIFPRARLIIVGPLTHYSPEDDPTSADHVALVSANAASLSARNPCGPYSVSAPLRVTMTG